MLAQSRQFGILRKKHVALLVARYQDSSSLNTGNCQCAPIDGRCIAYRVRHVTHTVRTCHMCLRQ